MNIEHSDKRYRVVKELGRGHSGTVYLAIDPQERQVAIKCLASQCNESKLQRFQQEFVTLRSLQHPNIAQPIDFGFEERLQRHFFVAEYVSGVTLDVALNLADEEEALRLFSQALRALDYMHRQGVFHCDLKPGNILVGSDGGLKIIDFDVAVRGTQAIGGTPSYCAPELLTGEDPRPNAKSDLFSLGATFYHCLTREKPYAARSFAELIAAHSSQRPKLPSEISPRLGTTWDGLLMGLLQTNPSKRFATASAVLQQIHPLLGQKKPAFSEADIAYRLRQHGLPVGKDLLLNQVQYFLDTNPKEAQGARVCILNGASGLGATYSADEIKAMAQLRGLPCYLWNQERQTTPQRYPFVWILDDLASCFASSQEERWKELSARLKEYLFKGTGERWWIVLTGIPDAEQIPSDLQPFLQDTSLYLQLESWTPLETQVWLSDIFQTEEIPGFLVQHLQLESGGNPKQASRLLHHYLRSGLILDAQGHWRKDLFHPSPMFLQQFRPERITEEYEDRLAALNSDERELLIGLALSYGSMPGIFFETLLANPDVHASLHRLTALGLASEDSDSSYRIASTALRNLVTAQLSETELRHRHDRLAPITGEEAAAYHRAHGSDPETAAQAWGELGDRSARRGLWQSAEEHYTRAQETAPDTAIDLRFRYSIDRGRCMMQRGSLEAAKAYFDSLLQQFSSEKKQNRHFLAKICERLGVLETKCEKLDKARDYFRAGIRCLEPDREPLEQYLGLQNFLAGIDLMSGNSSEAVAAFKNNFEAAERLPWERRRILTNNDLGAALLQNGQAEEALAHWRSLLADLERREDKNPLVRCLFQLGQAHLEREENEAALECLQRAVTAAKGLQNFEMELRIHNALANLWKPTDAEQALSMYERALEAAFRTDDAFSTAVILLNMGFLLAEQRQAERAKHCLHQGLNYLSGLSGAARKHPAYFHSTHLELSKLSAQLSQPEDAVAEAYRALACLESNPQLEPQRFETLGTLWQALMLANEVLEALRVKDRLLELATPAERREQLRNWEAQSHELGAQLAAKRAPA